MAGDAWDCLARLEGPSRRRVVRSFGRRPHDVRVYAGVPVRHNPARPSSATHAASPVASTTIAAVRVFVLIRRYTLPGCDGAKAPAEIAGGIHGPLPWTPGIVSPALARRNRGRRKARIRGYRDTGHPFRTAARFARESRTHGSQRAELGQLQGHRHRYRPAERGPSGTIQPAIVRKFGKAMSGVTRMSRQPATGRGSSRGEVPRR